MGSVLANLPRIGELGVAQNMGTASRYETACSAAWSNLARGKGGTGVFRDELIRPNRERLERCIGQQKSEFYDRARAQASDPQTSISQLPPPITSRRSA